MNPLIVIPARLASRRFPGKLLKEIGGCTILQHTWERCTATGYPVVIATEDDEIAQRALRFGAQICGDVPGRNGTERMAHIAMHRLTDYDIYVDVQGDLPFVDSAVIKECAEGIDCYWDMVTPAFWDSTDTYDDSNCVSVVVDDDMRALYFSRWGLPYYTDDEMEARPFYHHVGIYAYTREALLKYLPHSYSYYERQESLEQLRALTMGLHVRVVQCSPTISIDTEHDYERTVKAFELRRAEEMAAE